MRDQSGARLITMAERLGKPIQEPRCTECGKPGIYLCLECDAKREEADRSRRQKAIEGTLEKQVLRICQANGMGVRFLNHELGTLQAPLQRILAKLFQRWQEGTSQGVGFYGTSGGQKTGALAEAMKEHVRQRLRRIAMGDGLVRGPWPAWYGWTDLVKSLYAESREFGWGYDETHRALAQVPLLVLDDLGAEQEIKDADHAFASSALGLIVNTRYEANRPILWSSNYDLAKLEERYTARTVSRLKEIAPPARVMSADKRR